jgi:hypothetical protein
VQFGARKERREERSNKRNSGAVYTYSFCPKFNEMIYSVQAA